MCLFEMGLLQLLYQFMSIQSPIFFIALRTEFRVEEFVGVQEESHV